MSNRLQPKHYTDLDSVLSTAWRLLSRGARDTKFDGHIVHVATVTGEGFPTIRSVVLRGFDQRTRTLRFHTDSRSRKSSEVFERPQIAAHLYAKRQKIQLRMLCRATLHHRDTASSAAWRSMQEMSRRCYHQVQPPGTVLEAPTMVTSESDLDADRAYDNFAVVAATIQKLEWLYLSAAGHRRALFDWRNGKETATWLAP